MQGELNWAPEDMLETAKMVQALFVEGMTFPVRDGPAGPSSQLVSPENKMEGMPLIPFSV